MLHQCEKNKKFSDKDIRVYAQWLQWASEKRQCEKYDLCPVVNEWSNYDCFQIKYDCDGDWQLQCLELKGRYYKSTAFPDCIVEYTKIKKLQRYSATTNIPVFLIGIYYPDRKMCIWKIDPEKEYQIVDRLCEHTQDDWSKGKIIKQVVAFPMTEAKKYTIPQHISFDC